MGTRNRVKEIQLRFQLLYYCEANSVKHRAVFFNGAQDSFSQQSNSSRLANQSHKCPEVLIRNIIVNKTWKNLVRSLWCYLCALDIHLSDTKHYWYACSGRQQRSTGDAAAPLPRVDNTSHMLAFGRLWAARHFLPPRSVVIVQANIVRRRLFTKVDDVLSQLTEQHWSRRCFTLVFFLFFFFPLNKPC